MANESVVHVSENSPEHVAYKLMSLIARSDGYTLSGMGEAPPREWLLKTFSACLLVVKSPNYPEDAIKILPQSRV